MPGIVGSAIRWNSTERVGGRGDEVGRGNVGLAVAHGAGDGRVGVVGDGDIAWLGKGRPDGCQASWGPPSVGTALSALAVEVMRSGEEMWGWPLHTVPETGVFSIRAGALLVAAGEQEDIRPLFA